MNRINLGGYLTFFYDKSTYTECIKYGKQKRNMRHILEQTSLVLVHKLAKYL